MILYAKANLKNAKAFDSKRQGVFEKCLEGSSVTLASKVATFQSPILGSPKLGHNTKRYVTSLHKFH